MEDFWNHFISFNWGEYLRNIVAIGGVAALIYGISKGVLNFIYQRKNERQAQFDSIVSHLTSDSKTVQLSSAILLRRFIKKTSRKWHNNLHSETINVISSLSRVLPTGIFQKTLVDGLAYARDISGYDLQKTNLQDVYLGVKQKTIKLNSTDLYLADLSYALIENVIGYNIVFYRAILMGAKIKNCNFTNGNFRDADLTNVVFKNVILKNSDFTGAYNIPQEIQKYLENGIYTKTEPVTTRSWTNGKIIFFSMPGKLSKKDEILTSDFKKLLEKKGYEVIYYTRDLYPSYGQFNKVRQSISRSSGMIAFGLKQINIERAVYRPDSSESEIWENKWLSTPWSEIEIGMGLMKGLPILLVCDPEINSGAFDNCLSECFVSTVSLNEDCRTLEQNKQFDEWLSKL